MEYRPVINAEREGVHCASGAKLTSNIPSIANVSIRVVEAAAKWAAMEGTQFSDSEIVDKKVDGIWSHVEHGGVLIRISSAGIASLWSSFGTCEN